MLTLAVDTAAEIGSIALASFSPDGASQTLEQIRLQAPGGFGQILFGKLEALLARGHVRLADIDLYAASTGPGSFTGVRVGLAAIKGLAEVSGKPAVGVSSLAALAQYGSTDLRAPLIDAKRGEVFAALYDVNGEEIIPESVLPFREFQALIGSRRVEYISAGFDPGQAVTAAPHELAGMVARLAIQRYLSGGSCDPASIEANYVRRSDAEILWKE
jgi:tRNA threonylcarbamoyladenosine biosynthesis protein TsaB